MAKLPNMPPRAPLWPSWGGPRTVREKLVDPAEFDRKKKVAKKGDPKNPALASAALLDWIGPGHNADELRMPLPPHPEGHDADLEGFNDRPQLESLAERAEGRRGIDRALARILAAPDRMDRLKALLGREDQMLALKHQLHEDVQEIQRKMRDEQRDQGY